MTLLDLLSKAEQRADAEFLRDGLKLLTSPAKALCMAPSRLEPP